MSARKRRNRSTPATSNDPRYHYIEVTRPVAQKIVERKRLNAKHNLYTYPAVDVINDSPDARTVTVRIRKTQSEQINRHGKNLNNAKFIQRELTRYLRPSVPLVGLLFKARRRLRCENNKAARRTNFFKSKFGGRTAPKQQRRKHRC